MQEVRESDWRICFKLIMDVPSADTSDIKGNHSIINQTDVAVDLSVWRFILWQERRIP